MRRSYSMAFTYDEAAMQSYYKIKRFSYRIINTHDIQLGRFCVLFHFIQRV